MKKITLTLFSTLLFLGLSAQNYLPSGESTNPMENVIFDGARAFCYECPDKSEFANPPGNTFAGTSEDQSCWVTYDNFSNVNTSFTEVTFWGFDLFFTGSSWTSCTPTLPKMFEITFYNDNSGSIGTVAATFTVSPLKEFCMLVDIYGGNKDLYKYTVDLPSAVSLASGWISIKAVGGTDNCWFLWAGSTSDDNFAEQYCGTSLTVRSNDFAFCLGEGSPQQVPVSNWPIVVAVLLIGTFIVIRFRTRMA